MSNNIAKNQLKKNVFEPILARVKFRDNDLSYEINRIIKANIISNNN